MLLGHAAPRIESVGSRQMVSRAVGRQDAVCNAGATLAAHAEGGAQPAERGATPVRMLADVGAM